MYFVQCYIMLLRRFGTRPRCQTSGKEGLLTKLPKSGNFESVISTEVSCYCLFLGKVISRILLDIMKTAVDPADRVP